MTVKRRVSRLRGRRPGNFGLDVHIDTGLVPLSGGSLLSADPGLFVTPVWLAVVWLVRVLAVMLEWCFGLDLLDGASGSLRAALSRADGALTVPWLPLALAIAAALVAYHGSSAGVDQTLGEALAMFAMFACGPLADRRPGGHRRSTEWVERTGGSGDAGGGCSWHPELAQAARSQTA